MIKKTREQEEGGKVTIEDAVSRVLPNGEVEQEEVEKLGTKIPQGCRRHGIKFTLKDMDSFGCPILSLMVHNKKRFHFIQNFKVQGHKI